MNNSAEAQAESNSGEGGVTGASSLFAKREKIYPRQVSGRFSRLRAVAVWWLLGMYYLAPWINWQGRQAVLFDLPARKFNLVFWTFWPQDFIFLTLLLIVAALSLFFFTALAGRLWCGYACPQTVWTETFIWMERWIEGDRARQIKLSEAPWSWRKLRIKSAKYGVWLLFAAWTGFTFVGFFSPIRELGQSLLRLELGGWESFWILFYGAATYFNAGWMREQVCIYMCPYARFQSAMLDHNSMIVSYDAGRGEPRGSRARGVVPDTRGLGDCIDCTLCVQVCPTGIDIREGLQYQCIGCAACIDVCDGVMDKMGYERGLVRYTTENRLAGRTGSILRPRIAIYGLLLTGLILGGVFALSQRVPARLDVIRDRNTLYRELPDGSVENVYTLKLLNMDRRSHRYAIRVEGVPGLLLVTDHPKPEVDSGEVLPVPVKLRLQADQLTGSNLNIRFVIQAEDDEDLMAESESRFIAPLSVVAPQ